MGQVSFTTKVFFFHVVCNDVSLEKMNKRKPCCLYKIVRQIPVNAKRREPFFTGFEEAAAILTFFTPQPRIGKETTETLRGGGGFQEARREPWGYWT